MPTKIDPIATNESKTSLNGNSTTSTNSDSNFEEQLKTEEEKLKSKTALFAPGGPLETLFASLSYHYDESLTLSKIESDFERPKYSPPPQTKNNLQSGTKLQEENIAALPMSAKRYEIDPKVFQDLISRSLGAFNLIPLFLPLSENALFITKTNLGAVIDDIVKKVALMKDAKSSELLLSLKPEQLGEMLLKVSNKNGMISIHITANDETKKLLDLNLEGLKEALSNAQLNIGSVSVSVGQDNTPSKQPELFSDLSTKISQTLLENNSQNMVNLLQRRIDLENHLIDWEA